MPSMMNRDLEEYNIAWDFVNQVLQCHNNFQNNPCNNKFEPFANVHLVVELLKLQSTFHRSSTPSKCGILFHYTSDANINSISNNSLESHPERTRRCADTKKHGAVFGEGIYTGNNWQAFSQYGDTGVIAACLPGATVRVQGSSAAQRLQALDYVHSIVGNKKIKNPLTNTDPFDEIVLKTSEQCVPLIKYAKNAICDIGFEDLLQNYAQSMHQLTNQFINRRDSRIHVESELFNPYTCWPPSSQLSLLTPWQVKVWKAIQQPTVPVFAQSSNRKLVFTVNYTAPTVLGSTSGQEKAESALISTTFMNTSDKDCSICLEPFLGPRAISAIKCCGHVFHRDCILNAMTQAAPKCPICRMQIGKPQGKMVSGTMTVHHHPDMHCNGYIKYQKNSTANIENASNGVIMISYEMPQGRQMSYHENPGEQYAATNRLAYLPATKAAEALLKRLKLAFEHGLTFTIGTSLTTGRSGVIVWGSIHHKTSVSPGPHGFPDPEYFSNCNSELDNVGVPAACDIS